MAITIRRALPWTWLAILSPIFGQQLTLTPAGGALPPAAVGVAYNQTISVTGGTVPYAWNFPLSALTGTGLSFAIGGAGNANLTISGTPLASAVGTYNLSIVALDSTLPVPKGSGSIGFTLVVGSPVSITTASLPAGTQGVAYGPVTLQASGGTGSGYTFAVSAGSLPQGLTMAAGVISGTPTGSGSTFTIRVTDSGGNTGTKDFTITVGSSLTITTPSLPAGTVGIAYSATLAATGGSGGTRTWSATGLPAGLSINATSGAITGTPTAAGSSTVNVSVSDGTSTTRTYTLTIAPGLTITTTTLPTGTTGTFYSATVEASGGSGTRTWSATGLTNGLSINATTGQITGTPTLSGPSAPTITVTDSTGPVSKQFSLVIASGVTITTDALPAGSAGVAYSFTLSATGGSGTRTWGATGLPNGLTVNSSTGLISGTPTAAASATVTITLQDGTGTTSKTLTLTIAAGLTISTTSLPAGTSGAAYTATVEASGGSGARTWSATGLPTGLSINTSSGVISGTPTQASTFVVTVTVQDSTGSTNKQFSLVVSEGLTITTTSLASGAQGVAYSFTLAASGATAALVWQVTGLPTGLTVNSSTGVISGTPQVNGSFPLTVTVTSGASSSTKQLALAIAGPLSITTTTLPAGTVGSAYFATVESSGGSGVNRVWSATGLPAGLSINAASGLISGTPQTAGSTQPAISITDSTGTVSRQFTLSISGGSLTISTASLPGGAVGVLYSASVQAAGGSGNYSWSASGLPAGVSIVAATGALTGTPTQAGTFTPTITVSDGALSVNKQLTIVIGAGLNITTTTLANASAGVAYQAQLQATGGAGTLVWGVATGSSLPAGLSLNPSSGLLSGTPATAGTTTFTIQVTDGASTANRQFTLTVAQGITITTQTLPAGTTGVAYSAQLEATGGSGTRTWSAIGLPQGLSINTTTGLISGTPAANFSGTVSISVSDTGGGSNSRQFTLLIGAGLTITTLSLPNGAVGVQYLAALEATGGSGVRTWSAVGLPQGLAINTLTGAVSGTPLAAATAAQVSFSVSDSSGSTSRVIPITIIAGLNMLTTSLPGGRVGSVYSFTMQATGGSGNYTWSAVSLPVGLSIIPASGVITGTPTQLGTSTPTITVSDGVNPSVTRQFSLVIGTSASITISNDVVPNGAVGAIYSTQLFAAGGTQSVTWRVTAGALPPGLQLAGGSGALTGTPIRGSGGQYSFVIEASDGATSTTKNYTITILEIVTAVLPTLTGQPVQLLANVGTGVVWTVAAGSALPAGMTLQSAGVLSGIPAVAGTYAFTIQATWQGVSTLQTYTITTGGGSTVTISTNSLPAGAAGTAYNAVLQATGGSGTHQWQVLSGQLPPGLALSVAGLISGVPSENGTFNFVVRATDAANAALADVRQFTITVGAGGFSIVTATLAQGTVNNVYNVTLTASGGVSPYSWTVTAGQLPFGIGLSPGTGLLSGTPLLPGSYSFTVRATDLVGAFAIKQFVLVVNAGISVSTTALPGASLNTAYNSLLSASGGSGNGYTWSIPTGQLPPGLTLGPQTGILTGTPTSPGTFNFTVQVTDSAGATATRPFTLTVGSALTITSVTLPNGATGVPYNQTLTAAGGTPPLNWSIQTGALPAGLQLSGVTGAITGSPTSSGPSNFTVLVRDANANTATRLFTMVITEGLTISTASLPTAVEGSSYTQALSATGGSAPYTWMVAVGSLPPGLSLNPGGTISGTPTTSANYSFIVQVTDAGQQTVTKAFTLIVNARTAFVISTPLGLPVARVQAPYSVRFTAQGGTPPYVWSLAPGAALPVGLSLDPDGNLTGSPTSAGAFNFSVRVTDSLGLSTAQSFSLAIVIALGISTQSPLPAATSGAPYAVSLGAAGGQSEYRWAVVGGALPAGLDLSQGGVISGIPTAAGTFNFDVQVTDSSGGAATANFTLVVRLPGPPSVTLSGLGESVEPAQQPRINVTLGSTFPVAVTGTVTMTFTPDAAVAADDPAVVFANGRRTATFTVDAGTTQARFADGGILQTGTVAGTIELTVRLEAAGVDITPSPAPRQVSRINRMAPVLRTVRARRVSGGLEVELTGFATARELAQAVFRFTPIPGSALQTTELSVSLADAARRWYESEDSRRFGSQFTLTQQFNVQGDTSAIASVTVTMSNTQGTSASVTANF